MRTPQIADCRLQIVRSRVILHLAFCILALALARPAVSSVFNPVLATGPDAMQVNPAQLAGPERTGFSCRILGLDGSIGNNSFTATQYNRYTGAYLNDAAKADILGSIPRSGLTLTGRAGASVAEFGYSNFAASVRTVADGEATLPKDAFDLALFGNALGRTYSGSGLGARAQVLWRAGVGCATGVDRNWAVGVGAHRLQGLYYAGLTEATGSLLTTGQSFVSAGRLAYQRATGGTGWAFDAGVVHLRDDWRFSLACLDASPGIVWTEGVERGLYTFAADSANAYEMVTQGRFRQEFKQEAGGFFTTEVPMILNLGVARRFNQGWFRTCPLNLGLLVQERFRKGTAPGRGLSLGENLSASAVCEAWPLTWLPVALELAYRGWAGPVFGLDLGFITGRFAFILAARDLAGMFASAKGAEFGFSIGYGTFHLEREPSVPDTVHLGDN